MAIDERSRHEMYRKLEEALGREAAATLMEHLPPVGWADVATKRDLEHVIDIFRGEHALLRSELREEIRTMETRIERALRSQLNIILTVVSGLFVAFATLVIVGPH